MISLLIFLGGILIGILLSMTIGMYLLMKKDDNIITGNEVKNQKLRENEPTEEEIRVLYDALKVLQGEVEDSPAPELHPSEEQAPIEIREMEEAFAIASQEMKKRQKHLKALTSFFQDYANMYLQLSKDLKRLSSVAQNQINGETIIDKWWNAVSVALEHLSKDENLLRKSIQDDILHPMSRIEVENSHLEKQLSTEGLKLLTKLKEARQIYDLKLKESEKHREKISSNSCLTTSDHSTPPRATTKPHASETALIEASDKLAGAQQSFNEKMPRILKDYKLITSNCVSASMERLLKLSDVLSSPLEKIAQILDRLKMDLASSAMQSIDRCNYNPVVLKILESISSKQPSIALDMTLESSAGLAASSLHTLPHLPPQFGDSIQKETCVWFNALSGRMYRDAARSPEFHNWFCSKASHLLNKGKKTPLFDKYYVSNPSFGSTPPLLLNVQWAPGTKQSSNSHMPNQDNEYDVECTADVAFRSSIRFTVSTRLWINWPREKCAHIPISVVLEVSELSGKIRFGVRKHSSFLSFVEEPYTRFNVTSEVGDQYKLKNIPKVSSLIINKLKKHIRTKLIYPGCFKLRLIWPRKWWPPGGEHLFKSEPKESDAGSQPQVAIPAVSQQQTDISAPPVSPTMKVTVDEVLAGANSDQGTLLQRWFWNTSSKPHIRESKTPINVKELFGPPGTLQMVDRRRYKSDSSVATPSTPRSGRVVGPDHVRLYVSDLLENETISNPYYANRLPADDILVGDKSMWTESVAIMRSRSHSISDFRHTTLDSMWSEFLGSIGHDFSSLLEQNKSADDKTGPRSINKDRIKEFRIFSLKLSTIRKKLRSQRKMNGMKANEPPKTTSSNFSGLSFLLGSSLTGTTPKSEKSERRNLIHELNQLDNSTSSASSLDHYYSQKFGRVIDILSSSRTTTSTETKSADDDIEQDAVNFAWQVQAEAITQAAARGEHLNMQNFLKTPKPSSTKSWVVMKDGSLTIYPSISTTVSDTAVEKNTPLLSYNLRGCICRPLDHHSGFEVGFMIIKDGKSSIEWVRFWTESNIQCKAWIMALQHSANFSANQVV